MLPLILGIGAAALLLGRKAVKRVRSNPHKRGAKRNPHGGLHKKIDVYVNGRYFWSTNRHATCASAKSDALAALRKRAAAGKVPIPSGGWNVVAHFDSRQRNPRNRWGHDIRKGTRVNVHRPRGGGVSGVVQLVETRGPLARLYGKQATILLDSGAVIRANIDDCAPPSKTKTNPSRRRKGRRVSVDQAASRLAWWRWHHNPKGGMTGGQARAFFDSMYARGQSEREAHLRSPAGEAERQARNRALIARMRAARKSNPRRRRRSSRRK